MKTFPQPGPVTLLVVILTSCLLLFLFQEIIWLVLPGLLALMLYYGVRPLMESLVVCGVRHDAAAKIVWLLLQLTVLALVVAAGLLVMSNAGAWQGSFDRYLAGGQNLIKRTTVSLERVVPLFKRMSLGAQVDQRVQQFANQFIEKDFLPLTLEILKCLPSLLLVPFFTYYMLNDSARLKKYIIRSVPNAFFEKALLLFSRLDASFQSYFQGLLLLTLLDTVCLALGLEVLGIRHALWLGLTAAVLAWIPYVGSVVGCVIVVLVAATDSPDHPGTAYACLFLFLAVRMLDDFIFMPVTIARKLHVHPLLSVLLLFLGATVAGVVGLLLVLPLFGVVAVIGEAVSQVVTDRRLRARYKAARQLTG